MSSRIWFFVSGLLVAGLLAGCGGSSAPTAAPLPPTQAPAAVGTTNSGTTGDPIAGQKLFQAGANGATPCSTCHSLTPDQVIVGPSLAGVATRAASRKPGMSAHDYIKESIETPNAYIVQGFPNPSPMPADFAQKYNNQQIEDLVAFLLTQK